MPGTLNVGGHNIITHSGTSGAGTINLVDQAGNAILTDSGSGMSLSNNVDTADLAFAANHAGIKTALNASGDAPVYSCRAWVNFNGTGTVAIRASGNVSSVTDNTTGDYTVNFTTAMPDVNYNAVSMSERTNACAVLFYLNGETKTTSAIRLRNQRTDNAGQIDSRQAYVAFFR